MHLATKKVMFCLAAMLLVGLLAEAQTNVRTPTAAEGSTAFQFQTPVGGVELIDWYADSHFDHDKTSGIRDYRGGTRSYDGHKGVDFSVPTWRHMDNGVPVLAAANGRVSRTDDGHFDRHKSRTPCRGLSNLVYIDHPNGMRSLYVHLKKGSVMVSVGQDVVAGQQLGLVGSSGCSNGPHLHFEVLDTSGRAVDPFVEGLWADPPKYDIPLTLFSYSVHGPLKDLDQVKDPPDDISTIAPGATIGIGAVVLGTKKGDRITFVVTNGTDRFEQTYPVEETIEWILSGHNRTLTRRPGTWRIRIKLNGQFTRVDHKVRVSGN